MCGTALDIVISKTNVQALMNLQNVVMSAAAHKAREVVPVVEEDQERTIGRNAAGPACLAEVVKAGFQEGRAS